MRTPTDREEKQARDAEQYRLCLLARGGDRDAADTLARAVSGVVTRDAARYARAFRNSCHFLEADLHAEGMLRLPACIARYDPTRGPCFSAYFAMSAGRAIHNYCVRKAARMKAKQYTPPPNRLATYCHLPPVKVAWAISQLSPRQRQVLAMLYCSGPDRAGYRTVARRIGISRSLVQYHARVALRQLSRHLEA